MNLSLPIFAALMFVLLNACSPHLARVKPFERGNLAHPLMSPDHDSLFHAMTMHGYFSREGSYGGGGVGGGGCGCN